MPDPLAYLRFLTARRDPCLNAGKSRVRRSMCLDELKGSTELTDLWYVLLTVGLFILLALAVSALERL